MDNTRAAARVLVVDDQVDVIEVLIHILRKKPHYEVVTTTNPIEALDRVKATRFDIVLSDVTMPEMRGTELVGHIQVASPSTRIILMSGEGRPQVAPSVKIFGFLQKPIAADQLLKTLDQAVADLHAAAPETP